MTEETAPLESFEQVLGHYRIRHKLAEGGMGEVFLAEDMRLGRRAAVKVISRDLAHDPDRKRRFLREAHAASKLNHPNIAVIYDVGETADGISFIGMEYVDGQTLAATIGEGLPLDRLLDYAIQMTDAVAEAHRNGIIHRDLKPQNVMITSRNTVKVLDFGLAKIAARGASAGSPEDAITQSGVIMGTLAYMSPEQARGQQLDHRSDIFSLGVILYRMATRQLPFTGDSAFETYEKIVRSEPEPISRHNPGVPPEVVRIVSRCLEKERERRYASADDLLADLRSVRAAPDRATTATAVLPARIDPSKAVAVLPFKTPASDPESELFGDGMTEELINALSNVKGLRVASRSSSFVFKGANIDVREIADKLRVGSVVEGSVRKAGDQIRVTVQLVDAGDGYQRWSQTFDRKLTDVFAVQDEIARAIAERVRGEMPSGAIPPPAANLDAYRAFVTGRYLAGKNSISSLRSAIDSLDEAVRLDPDLAAAHVELARSYLLLVGRAGISPEEGFAKATAEAELALRMDPRLPAAHAVLSDIHQSQFHWRDAERHIQQAIALWPDSPEAYRSHARLLLHLGRFSEAVSAARKAYELNAANAMVLGRTLYYSRAFSEALPWMQKALEENPESAVVHFFIAMTLAQMNRFAEAVVAMNRAIDLAGDQRWRTHLAHVYALAGDRDKAEALLAAVLKETAEKDYPRPDFASVYAVLGEKEQALQWLESAYEVKPSDLTELKAEPDYITLRSEPRFQDLLRRLGLEQGTSELR